MSDIFISYSRKDSEQALSLAERLRGEGMSVWIDQQGIEAAKTWSEEIVNAIEGSKAFLILLSSHSVESANVAKELSIAFDSERPLVPVAIEDVALTPKFKYPLAGVQRVAYSQFDAIASALIGCGVTSQSAELQTKDPRKSVLVMPFEDLSPTQDNRWFADGLAGELIDKLSHLHSLRLVDRKTSRDLRQSTLNTYDIAKTLQVMYVVEGSVRKFGEQIKISISLLNIIDGDHLWQESWRGEMKDIFDLQESVAERVATALEVHLPQAEHRALSRQYTKSAEAYAFWLKGQEALWGNVSRPSLEQAIDYFGEAVRVDPAMSRAWGNIAATHLQIYRFYEPTLERLAQAEAAIAKVQSIEAESAQYEWLMASLLVRKEDLVAAEAHALRSVEKDPNYATGFDILGFVRRAKGDHARAIEAYEQELRIRQDLNTEFVLLTAIEESGDDARLYRAALKIRPHFEKHLTLYPSDLYRSVQFAVLCAWTKDKEKARQEAERLAAIEGIDAINLINLAWVFQLLEDYPRALELTRASVERGYTNLGLLRSIGPPLSEMPEFIELLASLESKLADQSPS